MSLERKCYGLVEVSPLDLMDLLPIGSVIQWDDGASKVVVSVDDQEAEFLFTTESEATKLGLKTVDSSIHTLFKTKPEKTRPIKRPKPKSKKPAAKAGGKSGKR